MTEFNVLCLPGDGIGPEVMAEARKVLDAVGERFGHAFTFEVGQVGIAGIEAYGTAIREEEMSLARASDSILFGAVGGATQDAHATVRPEDAIFRLRKDFNLYANLRPVVASPSLIDASPLKPEVLDGVDMLIVRELTGGLYFGSPKERMIAPDGQRAAVDTLYYTESEVRRVVRLACELAQQRRGKVTSVDKANVLMSSRLWREVAMEVAAEFPDIEMDHILVDAAAMALLRNPRAFDVIVTENTFGDILTDEAAMLAGSLGMLPSASLNGQPPERSGSPAQLFGFYEPIHGTAPDIAGQGIANPLGMVLSAAMMLRTSFGLDTEASAVEQVVDGLLANGTRTRDLGGSLGTVAMGDRVADGIRRYE
ncbi:MAG: 3-isopropylmalate dehydrogenase [Thermomicrobiales bacterium]